jgi:DNA-directed RNA polymerase specialized sigma24 family protein
VTDRETLKTGIKKRLNSYRELQAEREHLVEELKQLEALAASPAGPNTSGMPRRPGVSDPVLNMTIKLTALKDKYHRLIGSLVVAQTDIEEIIEALEPTERTLARLRYIDGLTWEAIGERMGYCWRQMHRIHGRMLGKLVDAEMQKREPSE